VLHHNRLRKRRTVVLTAAPVAVPARTNLEIKRTIHLVLFRPVDARQVLGTAARTIPSTVHVFSFGLAERGATVQPNDEEIWARSIFICDRSSHR
jgi:hypothetical protein